MLKIKVDNKNGGIESALKEFKLKVHKSGLIQELKDRQEYVKPSVKRRKQKLKAEFTQKHKDMLNK